jgi:beta-lactamase class A
VTIRCAAAAGDAAVSGEWSWTPRTAEDGVVWSVSVLDLVTGAARLTIHPDEERRIASVGKLLLLVGLAARARDDPGSMTVRLDRGTVEPVADSGLWQHLGVPAMSVGDLALLVAAVSDNLATNVLLDHVGLDRVSARAASLGLQRTRLHDRVRDHRGPSDPPTLATGSAGELARLARAIERDELPATPPRTGALVAHWLSTGVDLSMVSSAFALDPLAHGAASPEGLTCWSKTGTDVDVRAEVGVVRGPAGALAFAAIANSGVAGAPLPAAAVLDDLRALGLAVVDHVLGDQVLGDQVLDVAVAP